MIIFLIIFIIIIIGFFIFLLNPKIYDKLFGKHTEIIAKRVKKGINDVNKLQCKYCGSLIESDSKFCKSCGKNQ